MLKERRRHFDVAAIMRNIQRRVGNVLFEHPAGAKSWNNAWVTRVLSQPAVLAMASDQCMRGLETRDLTGNKVHTLKPTRVASSLAHVTDRHRTRRFRDHLHLHLEGNRVSLATFYPRN